LIRQYGSRLLGEERGKEGGLLSPPPHGADEAESRIQNYSAKAESSKARNRPSSLLVLRQRSTTAPWTVLKFYCKKVECGVALEALMNIYFTAECVFYFSVENHLLFIPWNPEPLPAYFFSASEKIQPHLIKIFSENIFRRAHFDGMLLPCTSILLVSSKHAAAVF
jgi:hypothetical protein